MGQRGTKNKPIELKALQGNPGRRPINENAPKFQTGAGRPPAHLTKEQKKYWKSLAERLERARVVTEGDREALAILCITLYEIEYCNKQIQIGRLVRTGSGYMQQSPFVGMLNTYMKRAQSLLAEFGMTPAARSNVIAAAKGDGENAFLAFLNKKKNDPGSSSEP